jgi:hypothetical protein
LVAAGRLDLVSCGSDWRRAVTASWQSTDGGDIGGALQGAVIAVEHFTG